MLVNEIVTQLRPIDGSMPGVNIGAGAVIILLSAD